MNRRLTSALLGAGALVAGAAMAAAPASAGVTGPAFYVNGKMYRTVATPTDLSNTRAPAHSWDLIYNFGGAQPNVATSAPGQRDYNGGRWQVHALSFPNGYAAAVTAGDLDHDGKLTSAAEVAAALAAGAAVDTGVVRQFVCPVIPLPAKGK